MGRGILTSGFYIRTVGRKGNEETIQNYVENQDQNDKYVQLHKAQLRLFEGFWYPGDCPGVGHFLR